MKYGQESGNMNSTGGGSSGGNPKQPVGIIKKSSLLYRPPQLYKSTPPATQQVANDASINITSAELTVVGYSSNLYRDDFMALKLESRDILIPWNGDENLLIDR